MTPQPQHCEHECVCKDFEDYNSSYDYTPCGIRICADDTRSRPLSDELTDAYRNGYIDGQSKAAVENERNNNGRLKAERKRVLDEIPVIIRSDKDCIIRHNGFDYIRLIDVDVAVESMRGEESLRGEP